MSKKIYQELAWDILFILFMLFIGFLIGLAWHVTEPNTWLDIVRDAKL